jgi:hypothetical protein
MEGIPIFSRPDRTTTHKKLRHLELSAGAPRAVTLMIIAASADG